MRIKDRNFFYLNIVIVIVFIFVFDLPRNLYNVLLHNYVDRNYSIYGFCEKESYGYLEKIHNKYKGKVNINSYNFLYFYLLKNYIIFIHPITKVNLIFLIHH